jgi:hypothetical protein
MQTAMRIHSDGEKFSLLKQIRLARFPDDVRDVAHAFVDGQRAGLLVLHQPERRAHGADDETQIQYAVAAHHALIK